MAISKQEILAELERRGANKNQALVSKQEILAELERRGANKNTGSMGDFLSNSIRDVGKNFLSQVLGSVGNQSGIPQAENIGQKIGYGALPAVEQIPSGIREGLESSYAAVQGNPYKNKIAPKEYGAAAGKSIGHGIGQSIAAAPIIAAISRGLGGGVPANIAGTAIGFGATEPGGIKERSLSGAEAALIPLGFKALGSLPDSIVRNVLGLKKPSKTALESAEKQLQTLTEEEKALKAEASHKFHINNDDRLSLFSKEKQAQLENAIKEHQGIKPENFETMLPDLRHETLIPNIKNELEANVNEIKDYYQPKQNHGKRASIEIVNAIEGKLNKETNKRTGGIKQELGNLFDEFNKNLESENVQVHQTPELKDIKKALSHAFGGGSTEEERKSLENLIASMGESKNINAKDYMTGYRELLNQEGEAYKKAYSQGVSPKDHEEWIKKGKEIKALANKMESVISKQLGTHHLDTLRKIKKRYATEYAPLYENPLYQEMLTHGRTSKNIAEYLSGTTSGNDILRNQVNKNPELQRLIVGQSLGKNLQGLKNVGEDLEPYMKLNPKIAETLQKHAATSEKLEQAEKILPEMQKLANQRNEEFKLRQKEQERRKALEVEIPKLQYEMRESERLANEIKSKMNDKNLSKAEVDKLQKEYDRHIKNRDAIKNKLKGALYTATIATPLAYGIYKGKEYLNELFE